MYAEAAPLIVGIQCRLIRLRCGVPSGVDMLVDVHGDEELPYCFIAGSEGIPGWSERMQLMQVRHGCRVHL